MIKIHQFKAITSIYYNKWYVYRCYDRHYLLQDGSWSPRCTNGPTGYFDSQDDAKAKLEEIDLCETEPI